MVAELKMVCAEHRCKLKNFLEDPKLVDPVTAIRQRIKSLTAQDQLNCLADTVKTKYKSVFKPIPHLDELLTDVYCRIKLKDASKTINTHSYSTPQKYKDTWSMLIQQHLEAGCIRPSNSSHASPAFFVPKTDSIVLLRWVNNYRALNPNTVTDSHPSSPPGYWNTSLLSRPSKPWS